VKLAVIAIGRPGRGPEATLAADYAGRATLAGRALGLGPLELVDLEARKPGKAAEAELILGAAQGAHLIACDERGKTFSSRAFADHIALLRDRGERRLAFRRRQGRGDRVLALPRADEDPEVRALAAVRSARAAEGVVLQSGHLGDERHVRVAEVAVEMVGVLGRRIHHDELGGHRFSPWGNRMGMAALFGRSQPPT